MNSSDLLIKTCTADDLDDWVGLRKALWPDEVLDDLQHNAETLLHHPDRAVTFLARVGNASVGFAEATVRSDYVNGCATSPVAFLEGLYVKEEWRRRGMARRLCRAIEDWALDRGCRELASDTYLDYHESQTMHRALGFEETERVVYYRKWLPTRSAQ